MATKTVSKCPVCSFPMSAEYQGQTAICADCGANLIAENGVTIPTPIFIGVISFALGMFIGPALIASTSEGRTWLEKQARAKIRG